ncbi:MAG TPA: hypothetical protein VHY30_00795 [Verrucomicrobiae bacterium]|nr:hypothetical protein [Verrucomicrobiae bacterium]
MAKVLLVPVSIVGIFVILHFLTEEKGNYLIWLSIALPGVAFLFYFLWNLINVHHQVHGKWAHKFAFVLILLVLMLLTLFIEAIIKIKKLEKPTISETNSKISAPNSTNTPLASPTYFVFTNLEEYPNQSRTHSFLISATSNDWEPTVYLENGQRAVVNTPSEIETNGSWSTNRKKGDSGAGGYGNSMAGLNFANQYAPEGSLLMKIGDGTSTNWTTSGETQIVDTPGLISFMPNDNMNLDNEGKARAFEDNAGSIMVIITVSKASPK